MYERTVAGEATTFGVSGKLWRNSLIMYDRATKSLWSHVLGECLDGVRQGETLTVVPSSQTTWAEWKAAYPHTLVLQKDATEIQDGSHYDRYFTDPDRMGIHGYENDDVRLEGKDIVIGVRQGTSRAAYPLKNLETQPLVHDTIGDVPILVVYSSESHSAYLFDRRAGDRELHWTPVPDTKGLRLKDDETGSIWDGTRGEAISGPLAGTRLDPVTFTKVFWFAWSQFFPQTSIWSPDRN